MSFCEIVFLSHRSEKSLNATLGYEDEAAANVTKHIKNQMLNNK